MPLLTGFVNTMLAVSTAKLNIACDLKESVFVFLITGEALISLMDMFRQLNCYVCKEVRTELFVSSARR